MHGLREKAKKISESGNTLPPVEELFPAVAKWVRTCGWIEIGDQEGFGFIARVFDVGGLVFEDKKSRTLAEAMLALERGLTDYIERESLDHE